MRAYRKWINQPSARQSLHHLHGTNVLAIPERNSEVDGWCVYFLSGDTISMSVLGLWLSDGWSNQDQAEADRKRLADVEARLAEAQEAIRAYCKAALNQTWQIKMVGDGTFQYVLPWYTVTEAEYLSWPGRKRHMYVVSDVDPQEPQPKNAIQNEGDIARFVNQLRDIAKDYSHTQQLRERLAYAVVPVLKELSELKRRMEGLEK